MKTFLKDKLSIDLEQPSTQKGIALLGAGVALVSGHPELLTATVTEAGVQYGGLIGTVVPLVMGLWETLRNE
ncbi:hypothetical protein, partial [uncultured Vibrio sp.]|uniref:hypothetical protein n=1 Tax=uncultured Vibrio sp. TaxID=114054 RepID=UPI00262EBBC1